jgi:hypothetical protein
MLLEDYAQIPRQKLDPLHPSKRRDISSGCSIVQASSVRTTRTFRPDLPLCQEAFNCSKLHISESLSNMSERRSVFDQLWDFFPKHRYGKTVATVRTSFFIVQTLKLHIWKLCPSIQPFRRQPSWSGCSKP